MGRKSTFVFLGLAAAVAALIAVNVAVREDAQPELDPIPTREERAPRLVEAQLREVEPHADAPPEAPSAPEPTEAPPAEAPPEPLAQPVAAEEPAADEPIGCDNPFVPSRVGDWRRYVWRQSGEDRRAELRLDALRERALPDGDREIAWRVQITAAADSSPLATEELTTRCTTGHSAEEPWFGVLERSLGLRLTESPERWRWPRRLHSGDRFEGTAQFDPHGADMRVPSGVTGPQILRVTRRHVVGERESIDVPAGSYRAWRVDYEEQQAFGTRGERGTGTIWVAPGAGMVKSQSTNAEGIVQTIELVALGHAER